MFIKNCAKREKAQVLLASLQFQTSIFFKKILKFFQGHSNLAHLLHAHILYRTHKTPTFQQLPRRNKPPTSYSTHRFYNRICIWAHKVVWTNNFLHTFFVTIRTCHQNLSPAVNKNCYHLSTHLLPVSKKLSPKFSWMVTNCRSFVPEKNSGKILSQNLVSITSVKIKCGAHLNYRDFCLE